MIRILTLNLWRFYDFDKRKENITNLVLKKDPDFIFLQEVQLDPKLSPFAQGEILQKDLPQYKYLFNTTIYLKTSQQGKELEVPVQHGMAVLSKTPLTNTSEIYPKLNEGEKEPRAIQCFDAMVDGSKWQFANIHFANNEVWAKNQFYELSSLFKERGEQRIMAGDFNMFQLQDYNELLAGYELSTNKTSYISYPEDNGTLDYVIIPSALYKFSAVECPDDYVSDHRAVFAEIGNVEE